MKLPLVLALLLGGSVGRAQSIPEAASHDVSGTYASTFGALTLHEQGSRVVGSYTYNGGQLDGTIAGDKLSFAWREDGGATGFGRFDVGADGHLSGSWGVDDDHSSGPWEASPASAAVLATGLPPSPWGDAKLVAGAMPFELYMPWDGTFAGGHAWIGMAGLGMGVGTRVTADWYVGGTVDFERMLAMTGSDGNAPPSFTRLRTGAEARYIFGRGAGVGTVNDGPEFGVDRYTWVGMRAGVETLDGFGSLGGYGEVSIGTAFALGRTQIGMYGGFGLSLEPDSTLNPPTPTPMTTIDLSTMPASGGGADLGAFVTIGMIATFGG